ncbi:MAG: hypothetical protein GXY59_03020 [Bacteroidales bacterium]|nr:hypothetical protein [Bacteroidales bacterium]
MPRFLETCASWVNDHFREDFSTVRIILPNRRAALFFTAYLKRLLGRPVVAPSMLTIHELMVSLSDLLPADRLTLIAHLYDTWTEVTGMGESFDDFYYWGEVLLADFDDIDKYLVPAKDLFRNLAGLKEAGSRFDYLSEEQKKLLEQFWGALGRWEQYDMEKDFVSFWERLPAIYDRFRAMLAERGLGYGGMIIRDGLESLLSGAKELPEGFYVIAGMNALNGCEKKLFSRLRQEGRAAFLWDYDHFYLDDSQHNAGRFIRENLAMFPPPGDFLPEVTSFSKPKAIELVAVASAIGQAQVIPGVLAVTPEEGAGFDHTAVVLADESLLFPVLGAIPPERGKVNVTMGYPVKNSPVVSLLMQAATLLVHARPGGEETPRLYFRLVDNLLTHPFLASLEREKVSAALSGFREKNRIYLAPGELFFSPLHRQVFSLPEEVGAYSDYLLGILRKLYEATPGGDPVVREMVWQTFRAVEKLGTVVAGIMSRGKALISPRIYLGFLGKYLSLESVAFEGEPLSGLQVMGILETRCLDFDELVIVGLNEEAWPKTTAMPSVIPYNLRKGFGLPGLDDQEAMYAYYFYRLIQRAQRVTATWSTVREGLSGGELSRYGFQIKYRSPHRVSEISFDFPFGSQPAPVVAIPSGEEVRNRLLAANAEKPLSPSAIITFLQCRLRFYYRYVEGLREAGEVTEDIDRQLFGNLFHKAAENLYRPLLHMSLGKEALQRVAASEERIRECILRAFATEYFRVDPEGWRALTIEGKALLIQTTVREYLRNLLEVDGALDALLLHALELECETTLEVPVDGELRHIRVGGKVDRVDEVAGRVRVIDYKTGSLLASALSFSSPGELFAPDVKNLKKEIVQALIYSLILRKEVFRGSPVTAAIYSIVNLKDDHFRTNIEMNRNPVEVEGIGEELEVLLKGVLGEIYSREGVFTQTVHRERCGVCPYNVLCRRV